MKIVDANVLLYAVNRQSTNHARALNWLTEALRGADVVALPWVSLLAFLRISTSKRILAMPLTAGQAMEVVERWLAAPAAVVIEPTSRHVGVLRGLLEEAGTAGNLVTDAHLAALAAEHGAEIVTFDRDFMRFGVRVHVPD